MAVSAKRIIHKYGNELKAVTNGNELKETADNKQDLSIQVRIYQLWAYRLFSLFETVGRLKENLLNILNLIGTYNGYGFVIFQH